VNIGAIGVEERARLLGRALMAGSVLQLVLFLLGVRRRSYAALAIPLLGALTAISALAFWVGYTMANARFGDAPDYPPSPTPAPAPTSEEEPTAVPPGTS
jgi:drug/metabolite transporter (DMT)-like permease